MDNDPSNPIYKLRSGWVKEVEDYEIRCKFEDGSAFFISAGMYSLHYRRGDDVTVFSVIDDENAPLLTHMVTIDNVNYNMVVFASEIPNGYKILKVREYKKIH